MSDDGVSGVTALPGPQRPADPAGLRRHRLRWVTQPRFLELHGGEDVLIRGARRIDVDALTLMHGRCSEAALLARYRSVPPDVRSSLRRLVAAELALVAVYGPARIVALANLAPRDAGTAEVAVIVEDAFQLRGIGTALVRHVAGAAWLLGYRRLHVAVAPGGSVVPVLAAISATSLTVDPSGRGLTAGLGHGALAALPGPGGRIAARLPHHRVKA